MDKNDRLVHYDENGVAHQGTVLAVLENREDGGGGGIYMLWDSGGESVVDPNSFTAPELSEPEVVEE